MGFVHIKVASLSMKDVWDTKAVLSRPYAPVNELQMISAVSQTDVKSKLIDTDPHLLLFLHYHKVFISKLCVR